MKTYLHILLAGLLTFAATQASAQTKFKRRGRFVEEQLERKEEAPSYAVGLEKTTGSLPVLAFRKQTIQTFHMVKMYETILEVATLDDTKGSVYRERVEPQVVPGELMAGERFTKTETIDAGPFANETFRIGDIEITTDKDGLVVDTHQRLLAPFDQIAHNSAEIKVTHATMGEKKIVITRDLLKKPTAVQKAVDAEALPTYDVLESLGLDFTQLRQNGKDGLVISYKVPESVKAGETVKITIDIANHGTLPIGTVLVRAFSREPWLNGKLFYFGNIAPGKKASFTREIVVPDDKRTEVSHVAFAEWNLLGNQPEKTQTFKITRK